MDSHFEYSLKKSFITKFSQYAIQLLFQYVNRAFQLTKFKFLILEQRSNPTLDRTDNSKPNKNENDNIHLQPFKSVI